MDKRSRYKSRIEKKRKRRVQGRNEVGKGRGVVPNDVNGLDISAMSVTGPGRACRCLVSVSDIRIFGVRIGTFSQGVPSSGPSR